MILSSCGLFTDTSLMKIDRWDFVYLFRLSGCGDSLIFDSLAGNVEPRLWWYKFVLCVETNRLVENFSFWVFRKSELFMALIGVYCLMQNLDSDFVSFLQKLLFSRKHFFKLQFNFILLCLTNLHLFSFFRRHMVKSSIRRLSQLRNLLLLWFWLESAYLIPPQFHLFFILLNSKFLHSILKILKSRLLFHSL